MVKFIKSTPLFVSQVNKCLLETVQIKKAHQSLLRSREVQTSHTTHNEFSKLPNSAAFRITLGENEVCVPVRCGKKYLCFYSIITKWIELSNKNKNFFFMMWNNSLYTLSIYATEPYFDVI